jgi:rhodanese-related sulfurtransferase
MTEPAAVDLLLERARSSLVRVAASDLQAELDQGALLIDIRPIEQRERDGSLPGSIVIDRNVLEWRLDPTCAFRIAEATSSDLRVILVCNEGYGSSIAAANLQRLGLHRATDLIGGYQDWLTARPKG